MKKSFLLIFFSLTSCKSTSAASDASVTAGFVIIVIIFLSIFISLAYNYYEETQEKKEEQKKRQRQKKLYNSPQEVKKREAALLKRQKAKLRRQKAKEQIRIDYKKFRKENIHLFNASKNLSRSIQNLSELISYCKKCQNRDYTIWELSERSLVYRCDVCKRKSTLQNEEVTNIFNNYNYYLKLRDYCKAIEKKINIVWEKFNFDTTKFNVNTPLHRGITFKGLRTQQLDESNDKIEKRSRRISQTTKDKVWRRDEGKCVGCGSNEKLEFDHIIPFSKGGSNTYRNIQLLCESCNRSKSDTIG